MLDLIGESDEVRGHVRTYCLSRNRDGDLRYRRACLEAGCGDGSGGGSNEFAATDGHE